MLRFIVLSALCLTACNHIRVNETPGVMRDLRHVYPMQTNGQEHIIFIDEHLRKCAEDWGIAGLQIGSNAERIAQETYYINSGDRIVRNSVRAYYGFYENGAEKPSYVLSAYVYGAGRPKVSFRDEFTEGSRVKPHVRRIVFGWADQKNIC